MVEEKTRLGLEAKGRGGGLARFQHCLAGQGRPKTQDSEEGDILLAGVGHCGYSVPLPGFNRILRDIKLTTDEECWLILCP